jgi:hypothetical protein
MVGRCEVWDPHIPNLEAGLPAADLGANARATGEVIAVEQLYNLVTTAKEMRKTLSIQVLAELKKQQREAPFKAPQMDAPVQYTVLAEIPATNPADAHSGWRKEIWPASTAPLCPGSPSSVTSCATAATTPRPLARHAFDDLHGQDSVVGSDGIDGLNDEDDSDYFGY